MAQHRITYVFVIHLITALASLAILLLLADPTTAVAIDHDSRNVAMSDRHLDNGQSPPTPAEISDASLSRVAHMLPRPKIPKFRPLLIEEQLTCDGNDACNRMFGMLEKLSEYMKEIDVNRMFHQYERIVCLRSFFGGPICAYLEGTNRGVVGKSGSVLFLSYFGYYSKDLKVRLTFTLYRHRCAGALSLDSAERL